MIQRNLTFHQLPTEYQKALFEYCHVTSVEEEVINYYQGKRFTIERISMEEAKKRCMAFPFDAGDFNTFEEYHEWYAAGGDIPDHGESVYPVIECGIDEWLDDGWHRFHSYVRKNLTEIPVIRIQV